MKPIIRYWGRKAGDIARPYIIKYSKLGEVVLDPFGGAGSIIKTALMMGRRCIYSDLNPLAVLIASVELEGVDAERWATVSDELFRGDWMQYVSLYEVTCKCGRKTQAIYFLWNGDRIEAVKVKCSCGANYIRFDDRGIKNIEPLNGFPRANFNYPNGLSFLKKRQVNTVSELFTRRNLTILTALLKEIKKVEADEQTKRALMVAFASILYQASKMSRENGGTWGVNCYWIPKIHVERNPYLLFKDALKRISHIKRIAIAHTSVEPVINGGEPLAILNSDAKELPLPENSVHLVITDPPFTDEVQYFELSYMAASWLGLPIPFDKEIIVNPKQGKRFDDYCHLLSKSFAELYRVLKPGRTAIIMLHEEKKEILNKLFELVEGAGFIIERRKKKRMIQRQVGDRDIRKGRDLLILNCRKS
jgi:16S rRNA G966 N2-methylase RsmD